MLTLLLACNAPDATTNLSGAIGPDLPALDAAIQEQMDADRVPGLSACIVKDGVVAWCRGYGLADIEADQAADPQTPFLLASVSKAVVGVALADAAAAGLLDLDAPVDDYLPFAVEHPNDPSAPITARHLAAHVSGIADNWDVMDALYTDGDSPLSLGDFLSGYFTPGGDHYDADRNFVGAGPERRYEYSNIGAALAALVVQEATGVSFDAWCAERIFSPLGMENTAWFLADLEADPAMPYEWRAGGYRATGQYGFPDYPSGQLRASAEDTARLMLMVMEGGALDGQRVLSASAIDELLRIQFASLDEDQGLFWYRWTMDGEAVWGHNGGEWGASTEILYWPEEGIGAVVLMNGEGEADTLAQIEREMRAAAGDL